VASPAVKEMLRKKEMMREYVSQQTKPTSNPQHESPRNASSRKEFKEIKK